MTSYDARIRIQGRTITLENMEGLPDGTFVMRGNHAGDGTAHAFRIEHLTPEGALTNSADTIHNVPPSPPILEDERPDPTRRHDLDGDSHRESGGHENESPVPARLTDWAPPPEALRQDDFATGYLPAPDPVRATKEPAPAEPAETGSDPRD